jgi:hypothetical protein
MKDSTVVDDMLLSTLLKRPEGPEGSKIDFTLKQGCLTSTTHTHTRTHTHTAFVQPWSATSPAK